MLASSELQRRRWQRFKAATHREIGTLRDLASAAGESHGEAREGNSDLRETNLSLVGSTLVARLVLGFGAVLLGSLSQTSCYQKLMEVDARDLQVAELQAVHDDTRSKPAKSAPPANAKHLSLIHI